MPRTALSAAHPRQFGLKAASLQHRDARALTFCRGKLCIEALSYCNMIGLGLFFAFLGC